MTQPTRRGLCRAVRNALLLASLAPMAAVAQDAPSDPLELDRVEVTGSRIKKAELEGQTPVQTITRADIERSGLGSIGDILQQLTASGSALNTRFNSSGNFGFPPDGGGVGAGAATVDLRHLGPKRVLVLVDGVRWVNESSASGVGGVVDLNTIPVGIIDRIEVLEDGASSIYGSDAIAGVVNIITRRDYDGASVAVQYGEYSEGDGETGSVDLSFGTRGERHSFFFGASYHEQRQILSRDREQSSLPVPGTGLARGSSAIPSGRFMFTDPDTGASFDITPRPGVANPTFDRTQTGCDRTDGFICYSDATPFNFAEYNLLLTPSTRKSVFGQVRFDLTDATTWYMRSLYNNRKSANQAAAEPFFLGTLAPTNFWADNAVFSANNPNNPFGFDLDPNDNMGLIGYRPLEGGPRRFEQDVDTFYVGTGLEGSFAVGEGSMFWDVNLAHSTNRAVQTNYGSYNARRLSLALGDPAACAAEPGCVPASLIGPGALMPEVLAFIQPVIQDRSENRLTLFSANLSGDLFELPAGMAAFATGYEYRRYSGSYTPDGLTLRGEYNGVPSLPTSGEYDVNEFYGEFSIPLLAGLSLVDRLDLSLAGRYSDYSTSGAETTAKAGLRWQVNDGFLLRGTWAEGFRAPTIGELFGAASGFDAVLNDPCSSPIAPGLEANCATLGVPGGYTQPNPQISVLTGGNIDLAPELAESVSAGFVWSPAFGRGTGWSERFDVQVTWYKHRVTGAIQALDAQTQLDLCVATLDPTYCGGISRNNTGAISQFSNFLTNLGRIDTRGWDFDVFWTLPTTSAGQFLVSSRTTLVDSYFAVGADGARQPQAVGREVNNSGIPKWSSNLTLDWAHANLFGSWSVRHVSSLWEECGPIAAFEVCRDQAAGINRLGSVTYHDARFGVSTGWLGGSRFSVGVNNVFEKEPPICVSCTLNGYDASLYDIPGGRFWYLRAEIEF